MCLSAMRNFHEWRIELIGSYATTATIGRTMIVVVVVVIVVLHFGLLDVSLLMLLMLLMR